MDRRTFLKILASLGVAVTLPSDMANASQLEVDTAWRLTVRRWDLFEVDANGTLSCANFIEPRLRRELYQYSRAEEFDTDELERCSSLAERIKDLYREEILQSARRILPPINMEAIEDHVEEEWFDWFDHADGKARTAINFEIEAWLDEEPDWENEWENFFKTGTAQGAAYEHFLTTDEEMVEALGVVIIEGDCPGSSYYAAELCIPIDDANRIAKQNGWSIRFVTEGHG